MKNKGLLFQSLLSIAISGIIPSVIAYLIILLINSSEVLSIVVVVQNLITILLWIYELYNFRMAVPGKGHYYKYNMAAMGIYCTVAVGGATIIRYLGLRSGNIIYNIYHFMFFNFKALRYVSYSGEGVYHIGRLTSALIYAAFCFVLVAVIPLFIDKKKILKSQAPR